MNGVTAVKQVSLQDCKPYVGPFKKVARVRDMNPMSTGTNIGNIRFDANVKYLWVEDRLSFLTTYSRMLKAYK